MEKKTIVCANCRKEVEALPGMKSLCAACMENLPTAKYNSRIKE